MTAIFPYKFCSQQLKKTNMQVNPEFLESIGLTQFHFNIVLFTLGIAILCICVLGLCNKFGAFNDVQFQTQRLNRCRIIYFNHRGPYQNLGEVFSKAKAIFSNYFKISKMFGIYYDNPKQMEDKFACRSTIGIIVNDGQAHKIEQFYKYHPSLETTVLPSTKCLSTNFPYINQISFFFMVAKVYPRLAEHIQKNRIETAPAFMELYHVLSDSGNTVQVLAPLQNFDCFMLWEDLNNPIAVRNRMKSQ